MPCAVKGLQIPRIIFSMASLWWVYLGESKMNAVFKLKIIIIMSGNAERVMTVVRLRAKDHGKDVM